MTDQLSPEMEKVLQQIQTQVRFHAEPFKKIEADNLLQKNSASVLAELVRHGILRELGRESFIPTLNTLIQWDPSLEGIFTEVIRQARYEYTKKQNMLGVSDVVEALTANRPLMLPEETERLEFFL